MPNTATITSKRQLTIPVEVFRKAQFKKSQKVLVEEENGLVKIIPAISIVEKLAGSVSIPKGIRGRNIDQIIKKTKKDYFDKRNLL